MTTTAPASRGNSTGSDFEFAVIGLGSAGEAVAHELASAGRSVVGFDPGLIGGECPFTACMPSKSMLHDASRPADIRRSWDDAVARRDDIANHRDDAGHADRLADDGVTIVRHGARLVDTRVVEADGRRWSVDHVILATGAAATVPPIDGLEGTPYWTSDDALVATERPDSIIVLGGGPIGCELGEVFARYGSTVTIVEAADRLHAGFDREVADLAADHLRRLGIDLVLGATATEVTTGPEGTTLALEDGRRITADRLLLAVGTSPRTEHLGLETVGIDADQLAEVDADGRVGGTDWLWAIGDLNQRHPYTHGANAEAARLRAAVTGEGRVPSLDIVPRCVFTSPPAAHVGLDHDAATDLGFRTVRGTATYDAIGRCVTDELPEGLVSVVVDVHSGGIIGFSGIGARADDIVATAAALIHTGCTVELAAQLVVAFPTITQVLEVAIADAADARDEARRRPAPDASTTPAMSTTDRNEPETVS